jgi:hypothetical protein
MTRLETAICRLLGAHFLSHVEVENAPLGVEAVAPLKITPLRGLQMFPR